MRIGEGDFLHLFLSEWEEIRRKRHLEKHFGLCTLTFWDWQIS